MPQLHSFRPILVAVALASLLVFPGSWLLAQQNFGGSSARHVALGGDPLNPYLRDIMRVHVNPAELASDSGMIWGDLGVLSSDLPNGGSRYQYVGTSLELSNELHVGLILNRRESPLYTVDATIPSRDPIDEMNGYVASVLGFGAGPFGHPLSPLELAGSYRTGSLDVGGSVSYGGWSNERNSGDDVHQSVRTWRFKAGTFTPWGPDALFMDAGILVGLNSVEGSSTVSGETNKLNLKGGTELAFDVRVERPLRNHWTLIPHVRWYTFSWQMSQTKNGTTVAPDPVSEYSHGEFEVGIGAVYAFANSLLAGGLSYQRIALESVFRSISSTSKNATTTNDLPKVNFGAEIRLLPWLAARIGYFDRLGTTTVESSSASGTVTTTTSSELPWYGDPNGLTAAQQRITLGLGIIANDLNFDMTLGEGYFLNGPWPLSGTAQQMFGIMSVSFSY